MWHADIPLRRLIVAADVHQYSLRDPLSQVDAQQGVIDALDSAASAIELDRSSWHTQAQGDAELAILPPDVDEAVVVADYPRELATSLRRHNRSLRPEDRLRLRVAVHCGVLHMGALGFPGVAPVETCRLLDAPPFKQALAAADDADVVLIVSEQLFKDIVVPGYRGLREQWFRKVAVTVKEFSGIGYITLPGLGPPAFGDSPSATSGAAPPSGPVGPAGQAIRMKKTRAVTFGANSPAFGGGQHIHDYGSGPGGRDGRH